MKKETKIKFLELLILIVALSLISFFYQEDIGAIRNIGILGFVIIGFMWRLPTGIRNKFKDDEAQTNAPNQNNNSA